MKKILFVVFVLLLYSCSSQKVVEQSHKDNPIENRLSIMYVCMKHDIETGKVDSTVGKAYLYNLSQCIVELKKEEKSR